MPRMVALLPPCRKQPGLLLRRAAFLQQRCTDWVRRLVPTFSPVERAALDLNYRYSIAQIELATDVVFRHSAPLRACSSGVSGPAHRSSRRC
jgi:hypothetical protein